MKQRLITWGICALILLGALCCMGCKSEKQARAEESIKSYFSQESGGAIEVSRIEYLGDEQDYDGKVTSNYRVTMVSTANRNMSQTATIIVAPDTGEVLGEKE